MSHLGSRSRSSRVLEFGSVAALLVFLLLTGSGIVAKCQGPGGCHLEDDAHYYRVVARRLAQSGVSSFDGQTLTNGYHPLWLLVLTAQDVTLGSAARTTLLIELALTSAGLWFLLGSFRAKSLLFRVAFAVFYALCVRRCAVNGMEISLLFCGIGLFMRMLQRRLEGVENEFALGAAAAFCVGARLDSALFVLPMLVLGCGEVRRALKPLVLVVAAAAVYAGANLWFFGLAIPVSGAVKSMGGLQINGLLIDQMVGSGPWSGGLKPALVFANAVTVRPVVLCVASIVAFLVVPRDWSSRRLCLGFLIGFGLFSFKLVCLSSWRVWSWYAFPEVIALAVLFHVADDGLGEIQPRYDLRVEAAASLLLLLGVGWQAREYNARTARGLATHSFELINRKAVAAFGPVLNGARVAMGDRGGSFAWDYAGPVTQLEGIVGDRAYFDVLKRQEDVHPVLCARGVRYVLAYQTDLGLYDRVTVPVLRPALTAHRVPGLSFSRQDEVGRVFDLKAYDNRLDDQGDSYLYAWRLSGCPQPSRPD